MDPRLALQVFRAANHPVLQLVRDSSLHRWRLQNH
jgi:hypothetical protein